MSTPTTTHEPVASSTAAPETATPATPGAGPSDKDRQRRDKARARRLHKHLRRARVRPRIALLNRWGWYELLLTAAFSTTRQIGALHLGTSAAPTSHRGLFAGRDWHHRWAVFLDVFTLYLDGGLKNPNIVVVGDIGAGKSSFIKTLLVIRALLLGRRVVIVDKKSQRRADGTVEGEYALLARELGVTPIRFATGGGAGGSRINPLDPAIGAGQVSRYELLRAILAEALGRPIRPLEGRALRIAVDVAIADAEAGGQVATIREVIAQLADPGPSAQGRLSQYESLEDLAGWGREAAAELSRMVEEDLAGLVDGPTSPDINLTAGLTVFDISALPEDGPAVPIVMAIVNTWLRGTLAAQADTVPTVFVVDEAGLVMEGSFAKVTRRNQKVARGEALSNVSGMQHVSDTQGDPYALATLREAGTVVVYRQEKPDEARACVQTFGLPAQCVSLIQTLPDGAALVRVGGGKPFVLNHVRSDWEVSVANTDDAMTSEATIALHDAGEAA
ncbi:MULTISPECIES: ATP-binding protein [unclassified Cellulomonas]|uniref:ATP-binding protein n=1 Tax=unclassified Cellulomonas TaxID=2620175 RepID=UPI001C4E6108|nr:MULTISPECIES: ATP-binding protein [unclassified Cellulomonas]MBW0255823.1 ATP-binding protein [Cellulomonas sp. PS-H5]MCG7284623.1 ATP-binding protein [Cellulomonas sp. ACRRI]